MVSDTVQSSHIPVDSILRSHRRENLTFNMRVDFGCLKSELKTFEINSDGLEVEWKKIRSGRLYNMYYLNT